MLMTGNQSRLGRAIQHAADAPDAPFCWKLRKRGLQLLNTWLNYVACSCYSCALHDGHRLITVALLVVPRSLRMVGKVTENVAVSRQTSCLGCISCLSFAVVHRRSGACTDDSRLQLNRRPRMSDSRCGMLHTGQILKRVAWSCWASKEKLQAFCRWAGVRFCSWHRTPKLSGPLRPELRSVTSAGFIRRDQDDLVPAPRHVFRHAGNNQRCFRAGTPCASLHQDMSFSQFWW